MHCCQFHRQAHCKMPHGEPKQCFFLFLYLRRIEVMTLEVIRIYLFVIAFNGRSFASRLVSTTKIADIEKKLGFPEKPKRPLLPYMRFTSAVRPTLKDVGNRKVTDISMELGALWRKADDAQKAIYKREFEKEQVIQSTCWVIRAVLNVTLFSFRSNIRKSWKHTKVKLPANKRHN